MKNINCYKGIDNKVYMFGLNPIDFLVALLTVLPAMLLIALIQNYLGFIAALVFVLVYVGAVYFIGKSDFVKNRPRGIHRYLVIYLKTSQRLSIPTKGELINVNKH